jgi:glycosyltransferase involved in cell wall biosynthesis
VKIAFSLDPYSTPGGGSVSFARVLAEWLPRQGIEVGFDVGGACDAVLVFAHHASPRVVARQRRRGVRILHRIDERRDPGEGDYRSKKHEAIARLNRLADLTIFQSEFVRANMGPLCSALRSVVIHNGVDTTLFRPDGPLRPLEGIPRVLHVSWSIGVSKRLDRLSELLRALPEGARVYLAGRHAESRLPFLSDPRVRALGIQGRAEVAALMRSSDLLFFPSEEEPCPNTPIEAMASGLPILYHASGGTPEVVGDAGVPLSTNLREDLARALGEGPELRRRAVARGLTLSAERAAARYAMAAREVLSMEAA